MNLPDEVTSIKIDPAESGWVLVLLLGPFREGHRERRHEEPEARSWKTKERISSCDRKTEVPQGSPAASPRAPQSLGRKHRFTDASVLEFSQPQIWEPIN